MESDLTLQIRLAKEVFQIGDAIEIQYVLSNTGLGQIRVLPWHGYTMDWIKTYDSRGELQKSIRKIIFELKFKPDKEDFVELDPGKSYTMTIRGKLTQEKQYSIEKGDYLKGAFFDFGDSAVQLNLEDGNTFVFKGEYETRREWIEQGEALGLKNVWKGLIKSKEIKIRLVQ